MALNLLELAEKYKAGTLTETDIAESGYTMRLILFVAEHEDSNFEVDELSTKAEVSESLKLVDL